MSVGGAVPVDTWDTPRDAPVAVDRRRPDFQGRIYGRRHGDFDPHTVPAGHVAAGATITLVALAAVGYLVHILL